MDDLTNLDLSKLGGITGLITFVLLAALRAWLKDRREAKERTEKVFLQCVRQAYNSVENRLKKGEAIEDKAQAGLVELDKFMRYRLRREATQVEREQALVEFDALHGEFCPGGASTPPG